MEKRKRQSGIHLNDEVKYGQLKQERKTLLIMAMMVMDRQQLQQYSLYIGVLDVSLLQLGQVGAVHRVVGDVLLHLTGEKASIAG